MADEPSRLRVGGRTPYDVVVGRDLLDELTTLLGDEPVRVAVIHPQRLPQLADRVVARLSGRDVLRLELPDGEAAKTGAVAMDCWERLGEAGFTRSDAVVTVGGGATTDLGGFVAATWLRGVRVVHVPTSLLGMVDAAVGGKTGVNTTAGKNLVGAFHEPAGVICDLDLLTALPRAELVSGMAEVVKCGFVADPEILAVVEREGLPDPASGALRELVERAIRVKAGVVSADLYETGGASAGAPGGIGREVLNYGHTFGHAVEKGSGYAVRHGEAVALGMVYVAELARRSGRIDDALADRHRSVLEAVGLPTALGGLPAGTQRFDDLLATMRVDKKARGSRLRFVVLDGLARPGILTGPGEDVLRAAYDALLPPGGAG